MPREYLSFLECQTATLFYFQWKVNSKRKSDGQTSACNDERASNWEHDARHDVPQA